MSSPSDTENLSNLPNPNDERADYPKAVSGEDVINSNDCQEKSKAENSSESEYESAEEDEDIVDDEEDLEEILTEEVKKVRLLDTH